MFCFRLFTSRNFSVICCLALLFCFFLLHVLSRQFASCTSCTTRVIVRLIGLFQWKCIIYPLSPLLFFSSMFNFNFISPLSSLLFFFLSTLSVTIFSIFNFSFCRTTTSSQRRAHRMCTTESEGSARATI